MQQVHLLPGLILGLLFATTCINYIDRQALSLMVPVLRTELGLTSAAYGTITAVFVATYSVGQALAGPLVERLGVRLALLAAVVVWSLAGMSHALAGGFVGLLIARILLAISESVNWPAGTMAVARWFPPHRRASAMGIFDGGSAIGAVIAAPLVTVLTFHAGWRVAFIVTGVFGLAWALAWWRWYYDPQEHPWLDQARRGAYAAAPPRRGMWSTWGVLFNRPAFWMLFFARMCATPIWWFYVFWLPDYLGTGRGLDVLMIGYLAWIPYLTADLGKIGGGFASDRLIRGGFAIEKARMLIMVLGAAGMVCGLLVVSAGSLPEAILWMSVATAGFGAWSANMLALHADLLPESSLASGVGLTGLASGLGGAVSAKIIGGLVDGHGYGAAFTATGVLALVAAVIIVGGIISRRVLPVPLDTASSDKEPT